MKYYEQQRRHEASMARAAATRRATEAEAAYHRNPGSDFYRSRHREAQNSLSAARRRANQY